MHHAETTGYSVGKEQRVTAWDRTSPQTGELEEAKLDLATRDAATGLPIFVDWTVTCEHSTYAPRRQARSNKDGLACSQAVDKKRERYPPSGGTLVPAALEAHGRPCDELVTFVRTYGHGLDAAERSAVISQTWRQISRVLQVGNAEMVLSAMAR